jgi:hypothetical protein
VYKTRTYNRTRNPSNEELAMQVFETMTKRYTPLQRIAFLTIILCGIVFTVNIKLIRSFQSLLSFKPEANSRAKDLFRNETVGSLLDPRPTAISNETSLLLFKPAANSQAYDLFRNETVGSLLDPRPNAISNETSLLLFKPAANSQAYDLFRNESVGSLLTPRPSAISNETVVFIFCPSTEFAFLYVEHAVLTARAAGWSKANLVIIDTSSSGQVARSSFIRDNTAFIYQTVPRDQSFIMLQNTAMLLAQAWDLSFYFWQHADVVIFSSGNTSSFAERALATVRDAPADWAVIFFAYDWFSAIKTSITRRFKYDPGLYYYKGDCDFYHRIRLAGFKTINGRAGIVMHKKTPWLMPIRAVRNRNPTADWYESQGAYVIGKKGMAGTGVNPRSTKAWSTALDSRYRTQQEAGNDYYFRKWGSRTCMLSNLTPAFDYPGTNG